MVQRFHSLRSASVTGMVFALSILLSILILSVGVDAQSAPAGTTPAGSVITAENAAELTVVSVPGKPDNPVGMAWSPQGSQLAIAAEDGVWIYELKPEGRHLTHHLETKLQMESVAWSSDGSLLIASRQDAALSWLWDMNTGELAATFKIGGVQGFAVGDSILVLKTRTGVDLWGTPDGTPITPANAYRLKFLASINSATPNVLVNPPRLALSPDGRWLAFTTQPHMMETTYNVELWELATHQQVWSRNFDPDEQTGKNYTLNQKLVAFSPDSQLLAVHQMNAIRLLDVSDGSDTAILEAAPPDLSGRYMGYSPDGSLLAVSTITNVEDPRLEHTLQLWDLQQGVVAARIDTKNLLYLDLMFNADGTLLAGISPFEPHNVVVFGFGDRIVNLDLQPTATPTTPPNQPTVTPTPLPVLHIGGTALVKTTEGDTLNMRSGAGRSFDIVARLPSDVTVTILDGPQEADGYRWWQIRTTNDVEGWVVDEVEDVQTLIPQP